MWGFFFVLSESIFCTRRHENKKGRKNTKKCGVSIAEYRLVISKNKRNALRSPRSRKSLSLRPLRLNEFVY